MDASAILTLAALITNVLSLLWNLQQGRKYRQRRKELDGITPEDMAKRMHRFAMTQIGMDVDFLERINTDLAFLHERVYGPQDEKSTHTCPTCDQTGPELDELIGYVRGLKIEVRAEGQPPH